MKKCPFRAEEIEDDAVKATSASLAQLKQIMETLNEF